jgi:hypothetical protein
MYCERINIKKKSECARKQFRMKKEKSFITLTILIKVRKLEFDLN